MIRNRAVLDAVRDAIFLADVETGMIVDANLAAETLCGRSVEELRSFHHTQLHSPEQDQAARNVFRQHAEVGGIVEGTVAHKDGRRIPVEIATSRFTGPDGRPLLIGVFRDTSERDAAREDAYRSEERFRQTAESAGAFVWEVDAAGLYVYASPLVEQILGYTPDEIVGKKRFYDLFSPDRRAETKKAAFEVFARKAPFRAFLNWAVRKDGRTVALETSGAPIVGLDGTLRGYRGADRDVTERLQAEEALRQSEKIYRAIGESIDYGVWVCAPDGRNTYTSESFLKLVGLTQEQCSSFGWGDVLHPDDAERTIAAWKECVRTEGRWDVEHRFRGVDGKWHPILARGVPVRDEQGRITSWAGINLDISALKQAESQAFTRAEQLQAIMDAVPAAILIAQDAEGAQITGNRTAQLLLRQHDELPIQTALRSGQPVRNYEMEVAIDDGAAITLLGNVEPLLDGNGRPRGAVAVMSDITERKRAEAALRESEARFRDLADTAPVMIWVAGPDAGCHFFNKPWLDFTGRTMEEEAGDGWVDGVHPDDRERCLATYSTAFSARQSFQMEYRLRRADGEYRWILDRGIPQHREGEFSGYIGSCVDLTERKMIEERLRAREAQLNEAQRLAKVGSLEVDAVNGRAHWSDEMFRIVGVPNDVEPTWSSFLSRVHPDDREIVVETRARAFHSEAPAHAEFRIVRPTGEARFVRSIVEAIRDDRGAAVRLVGATQDVTDQVLALELLRESEKRLRNAERLAQIGNWRWDVRANRVFWSEELFRIFGLPQDTAPGFERLMQSVAPPDREMVDRWVRDCLAGTGADSLEFRLARPGGDTRVVKCIMEVSRDEDGAPARVSGTCQDVTESRRAQEEAFARQKLESVGSLASGIAHDFNNLLGAVLAQAEAALSELEDGARPEAELQRIRDAALQGSEIVRQLMIYAGKESEILELVDISRVVAEMLDLLRVSISKHASLETELNATLLRVRASSAQIRQIVMNLVTNASEAIDDRQGAIRVATRGVEGGGSVELEVSDTGCGMAPETRANVFDPFFTTKAAGRGLGLAVVQGIVQKLKGKIRFESEPGKGTTFRIQLPCVDADAASAAVPVSAATEVSRHRTRETVLLVEDEDPLRQAIAKMLTRTGFEVLEAGDGSAAIELLRSDGPRIDAVLLDATIPGRSSQDVAAAAAALRPELKVIVTSAYSEETVAARLQAPLIHGFIRKPFQLGDLVQAIRGALAS